MEKKEIIELVKYRNTLLQELNMIMEDISEKEHNTLHTPDRSAKIQRMKVIRMTLRDMSGYFRELSSFNTKEFTKFATRFLGLVNNDVYSRTVKKAQNPKSRLGNQNYYIVHSKGSQELVDGLTETDEDLEHFVKVLRLPAFLVIKGETVCPFKDTAKLREEFEPHYRLKYAIYELMQLKVDNPDITDQERYQIVLDNTRKRNETTYAGGQK